jgi:hypothetical protein
MVGVSKFYDKKAEVGIDPMAAPVANNSFSIILKKGESKCLTKSWQ